MRRRGCLWLSLAIAAALAAAFAALAYSFALVMNSAYDLRPGTFRYWFLVPDFIAEAEVFDPCDAPKVNFYAGDGYPSATCLAYSTAAPMSAALHRQRAALDAKGCEPASWDDEAFICPQTPGWITFTVGRQAQDGGRCGAALEICQRE